MENKYTIKYSSTFITQFNGILNYFVYELKNKKVAEKEVNFQSHLKFLESSKTRMQIGIK